MGQRMGMGLIMSEETRSYNELEQELRHAVADNAMLRTNIAQMRITIADYERADAVAEAMAKNNDVLRSVETRTYQTRGEDVEVLMTKLNLPDGYTLNFTTQTANTTKITVGSQHTGIVMTVYIEEQYRIEVRIRPVGTMWFLPDELQAMEYLLSYVRKAKQK